MRPLLLKLKNFIGIKNGLGLDEISIDLSDLNGLIALVGENGMGKTTVLDNMVPFRVMASKTSGQYTPGSFSFYNEVFGPAERELIFEMGGVKYRSLLYIDPERKKQEAYLYRDVNGEWEDLNKSGRSSTYDEALEAIVGSPRLFFSSIYRCQEAPRLTSYRKGVIKDILGELLMLESIKDKGKAAKTVVATLDQLADRLKAQELVLVPEAGRKDEVAGKLAAAEANVALAEISLGDAEKTLAAAADEAKSLEIDCAQYPALESEIKKEAGRLSDIDKKLAGIKTRLDSINKKHDERVKTHADKETRLRKIVDNAPVIRQKQKEEADLKKRIEEIDTERRSLQEVFVEARKVAAAITVLKDEKAKLEKGLATSRAEHKAKIERLSADADRLRKSIERLSELPCNPDLQSACPAVKAMVTDKDKLPSVETALEAAQGLPGEDPAAIARVAEITDLIKNMMAKADVTAAETRSGQLEIRHKELRDAYVAVERYTRLGPELENAEESMKAIAEEAAVIKAEYESETGAANDEEAQVKNEAELIRASIAVVSDKLKLLEDKKTSLQAASERLSTAKTDVENCRKQHLGQMGEVAALKASEEASDRAEAKLSDVRNRLAAIMAERSVWATLEKAFGNDGIIALEIDDAGPRIGSIANDLLSNCFGSQFAVRLETQNVKENGRAQETFDITVIDNDNGTVSSLSDKSGGQKTWLEDAVTKSIALVNAERSGKRYHTLFTDERDGALDQEAKREFFMMKRRALELGGFTSEFFISHTPESQDMSDRKLVFKRGEGVSVV